MMMNQNEPMMMGSPQQSPPTHSHTQPFLPAYLMGEAVSPSPKWASPHHSTPSKLQTRSHTWTSPPPTHNSNQSMFETPRSDHRNREMIGTRGKDKPGAPPVQGLLEHITSPSSTPDQRPSQDLSIYNKPSPYASLTETPGAMSTSVIGYGNQSGLFDHAKKDTISPAQMDPFYTQGENLGPGDDLDETWITIYGFPAAATSFILQQFSQYGNILQHKVSPDGNWMHVHYQSKIQAKKALSKNGKVFGGSIMVGVGPCIDKSVMGDGGNKENMEENRHISSTPYSHASKLNQSALDRSSFLDQSSVLDKSARGTPIRPLTSAYRAARNDIEVVPKNSTPQKNSNIVSKAMEYMFGW